MLGLFLVQLGTKFPAFESVHTEARVTVGIVYLILAAVLLYRQRRNVRPMLHDGFRAPYSELSLEEEPVVRVDTRLETGTTPGA
jgi:hypothetical protein